MLDGFAQRNGVTLANSQLSGVEPLPSFLLIHESLPGALLSFKGILPVLVLIRSNTPAVSIQIFAGLSSTSLIVAALCFLKFALQLCAFPLLDLSPKFLGDLCRPLSPRH